MSEYTVRNWTRFQHYKDRNPPWIKLHFELLSSADWVMLADASRVAAIACMLVASRNNGKIDGSPQGLAYLKRVAYLNREPDLTPLIECGFLESASGCKQALADACVSVSVSTSESASDSELKKSEIEKVFDHWRSTHNHTKAKLDSKRRKAIAAALKNYSEADLCQAITGYLNSPHHMGQNDTGTVYDDIELMLRDAKRIDAGLKFYTEPPRNLSKLARRNIAATQGWQPPEVRHANK